MKFTTIVNRTRRRNTQRAYRHYVPLEEGPRTSLLKRTSVSKEKGLYLAKGYHTQTEVDLQDEGVNDFGSRSTVEDVNVLPAIAKALYERKGEQWALKDITTTIDVGEIVKDIANGTAVAVSDGSYKDNGGTAAWILENNTGTQRIRGVVNVPGTVLDQSPYRSEIAGIYGIVVVVETIKEVLGMKKGRIIVGCDGKNALEQTVLFKENLCSCQQQHFDLISGIQGYIRDSTITYEPTHVKGHQDDVKEYRELDRLSMLNVEADCYAKQYWEERYGDKDTLPLYVRYIVPKGMWEIALTGQRICKDLLEFLRDNIQADEAYNYWVNQKERFTKLGFLGVDWNANKLAMKSATNTRRKWVTKFESGTCGTGRMMKLWKQRVIDNCPRCGSPNETTTHVLQCKSESATATWESSLAELENWLRDNKTCPDLRKLLVQAIDQWRLGAEVKNLETFEFEHCEGVYAAQRQIGWRQLMGGCLSNEWARAQEAYFKWLGMRRTGERWVVELIKKLWGIAWDLWQDRNERLHRSSIEAVLSGVATLDKAIREEYQLGNENLPQIVRDKFPDDIEEVLSRTLIQKKSWFVLVRAARELMLDDRIQDEFTDPQSHLRKWVGL